MDSNDGYFIHDKQMYFMKYIKGDLKMIDWQNQSIKVDFILSILEIVG